MKIDLTIETKMSSSVYTQNTLPQNQIPKDEHNLTIPSPKTHQQTHLTQTELFREQAKYREQTKNF